MNQHFDTARICPNGHLLTHAARANWPLYNDDFCQVCGEKLIEKCPKCGHEIRGALIRDDSVMGLETVPPESVPSYCRNCGNPYPWTESFLSSTREIVGGFPELSEPEKGEFAKSLEDVVRATPDHGRSIQRLKQLVRKLKKPSRDLINNVLGNAVWEGFKGLFS